jgi:hypothetical protein
VKAAAGRTATRKAANDLKEQLQKAADLESKLASLSGKEKK